jgi:hypothetical protein
MKRLVAAAALAAAVLAASPARADLPALSAASAASILQGAELTRALTEGTADAQVEKTVLGLPKNMGTADRIVRGVIAAGLIGLGAYGLSSDSGPNDTWSYVMLGVSAIPIATAATGYCPLYQAMGVSTR